MMSSRQKFNYHLKVKSFRTTPQWGEYVTVVATRYFIHPSGRVIEFYDDNGQVAAYPTQHTLIYRVEEIDAK